MPARQGLDALDRAVARALAELKGLRERTADAERRSAELSSLLRAFESGEETAASMKERLLRLAAENEDLRTRIDLGRGTVERLIARVSFLENQK